ncbi:hypothetical protein J6590_078429 [Homalodisca vitripennis]|nr:hypothetical protein J6590_078429 [Homalodisca vitripennis]
MGLLRSRRSVQTPSVLPNPTQMARSGISTGRIPHETTGVASVYCPSQVLLAAYYSLIFPTDFQASKESDQNNRQHEAAFKNLQLLTLPCLYILEAVLFWAVTCMNIKREADNYRTGRHRTVVYEHLPSQAGVRFINSLPDSMKRTNAPGLKTRLKRF